jgi:hypothetical protein
MNLELLYWEEHMVGLLQRLGKIGKQKGIPLLDSIR